MIVKCRKCKQSLGIEGTEITGNVNIIRYKCGFCFQKYKRTTVYKEGLVVKDKLKKE